MDKPVSIWATASPADLKALSDPIGNGILVLEVCEQNRFQILSINTKIEALTGGKHTEITGLFIEDILTAQELANTTERYKDCVEQGQRTEFFTEMDLPSGKFWWRSSLTPIVGQRGNITRLLVSIIDYSDRHRLENELRQLARSLQESQNRLQWAIVGGDIGNGNGNGM